MTGTQGFQGFQGASNWLPAVDALTVSANAVTVPVTYPSVSVTNNAAAAVSITMTTSGAVDGQTIIVRFYDYTTVSQTLTWVNTENSSIVPPSSSNGSTTLPTTIGFIFNGSTSKWRCVGTDANGGQVAQVTSFGNNAAPSSTAGTIASVPPTSPAIQTALGNISLGTAFQNTLAYDVSLTVYLSITANTSLSVLDGVGTTATPSQTTIITGTTALGIVAIRAKIPAGQYRLLSVSGVGTDAIVGQYFEAA